MDFRLYTSAPANARFRALRLTELPAGSGAILSLVRKIRFFSIRSSRSHVLERREKTISQSPAQEILTVSILSVAARGGPSSLSSADRNEEIRTRGSADCPSSLNPSGSARLIARHLRGDPGTESRIVSDTWDSPRRYRFGCEFIDLLNRNSRWQCKIIMGQGQKSPNQHT
jgi:hypothetical protein